MRQAGIEELLGRSPDSAADAPDRIYYEGDLSIPGSMPCVSVVGSRDVDPAGIEEARRIATELAGKGVCIVSGLAAGIDTAAHRGAIEGDGRTIAVLGTPLGSYYPPENRELQDSIAASHLVVSQFEPGSETTGRSFLNRNRTMAMISDASVVIRAKNRGGTMSHAWAATRLGRRVFISDHVMDDKSVLWTAEIGENGKRLEGAGQVAAYVHQVFKKRQPA